MVSAVAAATLDGQPIAISASDDRTLRIWDLAKRAGQ
jgi:WD40 repeat protein